MESPEEFIPVGKISGAYGVKGWAKIYSFTEPRDNVLKYKPLYLSRHGEWIEIQVTGGRMQGKGVVMGISNVTDRDQVMPLIGSELAVKREQLKPVSEDEFYWTDLMGSAVVNTEQQSLGKIDHMLETGASDVMVVIDGKQTRMIPFVMDDIVKSVDLEAKQVQVDWGTDY
jgi:16S rRNA processing protein RimM